MGKEINKLFFLYFIIIIIVHIHSFTMAYADSNSLAKTILNAVNNRKKYKLKLYKTTLKIKFPSIAKDKEGGIAELSINEKGFVYILKGEGLTKPKIYPKNLIINYVQLPPYFFIDEKDKKKYRLILVDILYNKQKKSNKGRKVTYYLDGTKICFSSLIKKISNIYRNNSPDIWIVLVFSDINGLSYAVGLNKYLNDNHFSNIILIYEPELRSKIAIRNKIIQGKIIQIKCDNINISTQTRGRYNRNPIIQKQYINKNNKIIHYIGFYDEQKGEIRFKKAKGNEKPTPIALYWNKQYERFQFKSSNLISAFPDKFTIEYKLPVNKRYVYQKGNEKIHFTAVEIMLDNKRNKRVYYVNGKNWGTTDTIQELLRAIYTNDPNAWIVFVYSDKISKKDQLEVYCKNLGLTNIKVIHYKNLENILLK